MILNELLYVAILPLTVAAIATFLVEQARLRPPVAWAASVALGYVVGQLGLASRTAAALSSFMHPREAVDWLPHAVLLALGITILATYASRPWHRAAMALAIALTIGLPLRLLAGSSYDLHWTLLEKTAYIALLSATLGLTWLVLAFTPTADHPRLRPILLMMVASAAAIVVTLSGVFVYGELSGVVAASLTGAYLVSKEPRVAGAAGVLAFSLGSIILLSCFYGELTPINAALLFFAMMSAAGPMPAFMSSRRPWQQTALRTTLTLLPLTIALAQTLAASQSQTLSNPYAV